MLQTKTSLFSCAHLLMLTILLYTATLALCDTNASERADDLTNEIFNSTLSPFCPGLLLRDCPSGKATELKENLHQRFEHGDTIEAVRKDLNTQFGEDT